MMWIQQNTKRHLVPDALSHAMTHIRSEGTIRANPSNVVAQNEPLDPHNRLLVTQLNPSWNNPFWSICQTIPMLSGWSGSEDYRPGGSVIEKYVSACFAVFESRRD